jgi:hypothetical protein
MNISKHMQIDKCKFNDKGKRDQLHKHIQIKRGK